MFLLLIGGCDNTPGRQLVFFNNSDKKLNIVLETVVPGKDGVYEIDKVIEPHSNAYAYPPIGTYNIITFDESGNYIRSIDNYELKEATEKEKSSYLCIDAEGKTIYALVAAGYLYEATGSLAEAILDGNKIKQSDIIHSYYKSDKPFLLSFQPIFPYEPLPKEIHVLAAGWTLVPLANDLDTKEKLYAYIDDYLNSVGVE